MDMFLFGAYSQEHQTWPWPHGGPKLQGSFIRGLLAITPEQALVKLGPDIAMFLFEAYSQEHKNWFGPDWWGPKWQFSCSGLISKAPNLVLARLGPELAMFLIGACSQEHLFLIVGFVVKAS